MAASVRRVDVPPALKGIAAEIATALMGLDPFDQAAIDARLVALDGTPNEARLGGNALTSVSSASFMRQRQPRKPLWHYCRRQTGHHSAAGNPDLRRRRACRTASRRPGLHDHGAARKSFAEALEVRPRSIAQRARSWTRAAYYRVLPMKAASGRRFRATKKRWRRWCGQSSMQAFGRARTWASRWTSPRRNSATTDANAWSRTA